MDRALAQGADVWLNTPRRPLEACGVGGMKAGMNGALNFSTVDGWWDEACLDADPDAAPIGFTIGTSGPYVSEVAQDVLDAASLYDVLEHEIVPRFYTRDQDYVPRSWIASVKQSMSTLAPTWDALRMAREYTESYYLPGHSKVKQLQSGGARSARDRAHDLARLHAHWAALSVTVTASTRTPATANEFDLVVQLGLLEPADLRVQLWVVPGPTSAPRALEATFVEHAGDRAIYVAAIEPGATPSEVVARILPSPIHADAEAIAGLITWSA
jgi:starch phosphorylase